MSRINHSFCRWCYSDIPLETLCLAANDIGISSIELVMPEDMPLLKSHGLVCAMMSFPTGKTPDGIEVGRIEKAFNRLEHHDTLVEIYEPHLRASAAAGVKNVIVFSGNREGLGDEEGLRNCATGLRRLLPLAEELGITLVMELLNSRIDHPDYQCDHSAWGVRLCELLDSGNFGLLYDVYHMQIMEGDVIRTIRENHRWFIHYHTGGCPGRNEIDSTQELNYPAIMRAIVETGYDGFVGQEFIPLAENPLESLRQAVGICSV
ncbi:TIM barrel protein [Luteolibacter yonseiensis]|uniref:TIM barrel protein n=1 Tax=Luteolibacter yonseiensis TaxID=1144680 RepID=A0A934R1B5_9BACT|nr:TIM barrel protein [Luteolibacter yonseiensis]MBK1814333.1 TIM barrel protein [Luteolibacter yonseiensis]